MNFHKDSASAGDFCASLRKLLKRIRRWRAKLLWHIQSRADARRARRREPALFNAAANRPAWQSSTRRGLKHYAATKATSGWIGSRSFSCTDRESYPWWMVELEADWPIYAIHIHYRLMGKARGTMLLQVSLSADQQQWSIVYSGQYHFGDAAVPGPLVLRLLDARSARFVKVELPEGGELALRQVEVMVKADHRLLLLVSRHYGFTFAKMTAMRTPRQVRPYTVRNAPPGFSGRVSAFHVALTHGRLGNNLLQIGTAACLAGQLGIRRVYLRNLPLLGIEEPLKFRDVTVFPESLLEQHKPAGVLCGTFFHREQFGDAMKEASLHCILEATRTLGRPLFHRPRGPTAFPVKATDLVVHLRAGDIFRPNPHPGYAQPPLAFYRLCIEFARAELGTDRVILVYQDEGNPCVAALKSWLDETGIACVAHARSLAEDMAVLLAASHCVFGHGTFGLAMSLLSQHLKTVLYSWMEPRFGTICQVAGIQGIAVDDLARRYIQSGQWHNSAEQRQMMLDYPIANLRLRDESGGAAQRGV